MSRRRARGYFKKDGTTRPITGGPPRKVTIIRRTKPQKPFDYDNPRRVKPMLAKEGTVEDVARFGKGEERKFDGTRIVPIRNDTIVRLRGRSWKNDFARRYPEIVADLKQVKAKHFVMDAELVFFKKGTDDDVFITALATEETKERYDVKLMIFDILFEGDESVKAESYLERRERLKRLVPANLKHVDVVEVVIDPDKKLRYYKSLIKEGAEGVMIKDLKAPYREGQRTSEWLKIKEFKSDEAVVVGITTGKGKRASTFGSLILAQKDAKGKWRHVGAASGFTEAEAEELLKRLKPLKIDEKRLPPGLGKLDKVQMFVRPELVVEIKYFQRTKSGKFRFPDFIKIRDDKTPDEAVMP